jgi:hypothetical protein
LKPTGNILVRSGIAIAALTLLAAPASSQDQTRIRAIVQSFNAPTLIVKDADGATLTVNVPADLRILANAKASLADIKPGDFVGSAADKGPDGKLHAEEVHIFPESMRGTGEGHRPMGPDPNRSMTNGTVSGPANDPESRTMTNGTVSGVAGSSVRTLRIEYKGGAQEIEVGPEVPIITLVVGDVSLLKPGAEVSIVAVQKDGGLVATRLTAEKDGVKPR